MEKKDLLEKNPQTLSLFSKCRLHFKHFVWTCVLDRSFLAIWRKMKYYFPDTAFLSGFSFVNWNPTVLVSTYIFFSHLIYDILWAVAQSSSILSHTAFVFSRCWGLAWPLSWSSWRFTCTMINITFQWSVICDVKLSKVIILIWLCREWFDFTFPPKCNLKIM